MSGGLHNEAGGALHNELGQTITTTRGGPAAVFGARDALFFVAELDLFFPGNAPGQLDVLRVSDLGYRTRSTDPLGVLAYQGLLDTAFEIDRKVSLDPGQASSRSDGQIRITNLGSAFDALIFPRNTDSRRVRVMMGQKAYDATRGIYLDPPYASLHPIFQGLGGSWLLGEDVVTVPIKDTSYWTQRPVQSATYAGTGGVEGGTSLTGKPKPMTRGGTADKPVREVSPVQVDPVNQVWQWTDGPGTLVTLYEAGAAQFTYAGDVSDFDVPGLYDASPPPGTCRTWNAMGLFRLGSTPVGTITADVTGAFAAAGAVTTAAMLAYYLLAETLGVPGELVDQNAFLIADRFHPYAAGFFVADQTQGIAVVQSLMASIGARLSSDRSGQLRPFLLASSMYGMSPAARLDVSNVVSVEPIALPSTLDPPPYRWQVTYAHNYTVQTSSLSGSIAGDTARVQDLATADRYAVWTDPAISAAWVRPNDPAPIGTLLLDAADAQAIAEAAGDLWRDRPGYYNVVVPLAGAAGLDIGSVVQLAWPLGMLAAGMAGQIVGEQIRSYDGVVTFQVLVGRNVGAFTPAEFGHEFEGGSA